MVQIIIVNDSAVNSQSELCDYVARASNAFLVKKMGDGVSRLSEGFCMNSNEVYWDDSLNKLAKQAREKGMEKFYCVHSKETGEYEFRKPKFVYNFNMMLINSIYQEWVTKDQNKIILHVKSDSELDDAIKYAKHRGHLEGHGYFYVDKGERHVAVGFIPLDDEDVNELTDYFYTI